MHQNEKPSVNGPLVSLAATRRFVVVVETTTSQADTMRFVSVNGTNVFQDNR